MNRISVDDEANNRNTNMHDTTTNNNTTTNNSSNNNDNSINDDNDNNDSNDNQSQIEYSRGTIEIKNDKKISPSTKTTLVPYAFLLHLMDELIVFMICSCIHSVKGLFYWLHRLI